MGNFTSSSKILQLKSKILISAESWEPQNSVQRAQEILEFNLIWILSESFSIYNKKQMFLINHKVRKFHEADSFEDVRYRSTFWRFQKIPHKFPTFVDEYVNSSDVLYRNIKERNLLSLPPHYSKYHQVIQIFEPPAIPPLINSLNPKLPSGKQYKISIIKLTRTPWKSHKYD